MQFFAHKTLSLLGKLVLITSQDALYSLSFADEKLPFPSEKYQASLLWGTTFFIEEVVEKLHLYFSRKLTKFDIPCYLQGTSFQKEVWQALLDIPYGKTVTYGDLARSISRSTAHRAVGNAIRSNPIAIVIPCHRVIYQNGSLGGYRWGIEKKHRLLSLEKIL